MQAEYFLIKFVAMLKCVHILFNDPPLYSMRTHYHDKTVQCVCAIKHIEQFFPQHVS